jgi:hypothetical protein
MAADLRSSTTFKCTQFSELLYLKKWKSVDKNRMDRKRREKG